MADTSVINRKDFSLSKNNPQTTLAIKIVGATLNEDAKSLWQIIQDNKGKDDAVTFCALSGILFVIVETKERLSRLLQFTYRDAREYDIISELFGNLEAILIKNSFDEYSIATIPDDNINKKEFWSVVFSGLLKLLAKSMFSENTHKDEAYERATMVNKIFLFATNYELVDTDAFLEANVTEVFSEILDDMYVSQFSNSTNKIWDAGRAAREYFLRKLVLFNPLIPAAVSNSIEKRWQAWFLLEDHYKVEQKIVKRKELRAELEAALALL